MKQISSKRTFRVLPTLLTLLCAAFMLTSCDEEDRAIAIDLSGIWEGTVSQEYFINRYGDKEVTYQDVDMEFRKRSGSWSSGTGTEIDYDYDYRTHRLYYYTCEFSYNVRNGIIYIDFEDGTKSRIRDYSLSSDFFTGYFQDYYTDRDLCRFKFRRVSGHLYENDRYYDYYDDYYYNDRYYPYYTVTRSKELSDKSNIKSKAKDFTIVPDTPEASHQRALERAKEEAHK